MPYKKCTSLYERSQILFSQLLLRWWAWTTVSLPLDLLLATCLKSTVETLFSLGLFLSVVCSGLVLVDNLRLLWREVCYSCRAVDFWFLQLCVCCLRVLVAVLYRGMDFFYFLMKIPDFNRHFNWGLVEKKWQIVIKRSGFCKSSSFSSASHCLVGATCHRRDTPP